MAAQPPSGGMGNRSLLIGAAVGCGCLSILGALVVVILILIGIRPPTPPPPPTPIPSPSPQPRPAPQPSPAPQPTPTPQPTPQPAPSGFEMRVVTVGVDQQGQATQPTDQFNVGDRVGALATWVSVPAQMELYHQWLKIEGEHVTPITNPATTTLTPADTGKAVFFSLEDPLPQGDYAIFFYVKGEGDQITGVAAHKFSVVTLGR